jgi:phage pi2 protein 07
LLDHPKKKKKKGVSHCALAIYIKKYPKAKEETWKFKYLTMQKYNLQKNPLKETKILQDIISL